MSKDILQSDSHTTTEHYARRGQTPYDSLRGGVHWKSPVLPFLRRRPRSLSQKFASIRSLLVPASRGDPLWGTAYLVVVLRAQRERVPA